MPNPNEHFHEGTADKYPQQVYAQDGELMGLGASFELQTVNVLKLLPDSVAEKLCLDEDNRRFLNAHSDLLKVVEEGLKSRIKNLPSEYNKDALFVASLLVDFRDIAAGTKLIESLVQGLFYFDIPGGRPAEGKHIVLANLDASGLIAAHRCLQAERTSCMAVLNTSMDQPWALVYLGEIEPHLIKLLEFIRKQNADVTSDEASKDQNVTLQSITGRLRELYELGVVERRKDTSSGKLAYKYRIFHPYRYFQPNFVPEALYTYKSPRLPRSKPASQPTKSDKEDEDAPGPLLPQYMNPMVGRGVELAHLHSLLQNTRLLTLTGRSGVGKTRLAVQLAQAFSKGNDSIVRFVPLGEDVLVADQMPGILLEAFNVQKPATASWLDDVATALEARPALLILDNFEHLLGTGIPIVQQLLERISTLSIVVTSQRALFQDKIEATFEVPELPLPPSETIRRFEELLSYASVELFIKRVQTELPAFQLTQKNAVAVAALCQRAEGLPLTIEMAALSLAKALTTRTQPDEIAALDQLRNQDSQQWHYPLDVSPGKGTRHQSWWAAIGGSYSLLTSDLRRLLNQLSIFQGGFTMEAAATVCKGEAVETNVMELQARSFLIEEEFGTGKRYRLSEMIREFAAAQLEAKEQTQLERSYANYFLILATSAKKNLKGPEQVHWFRVVNREYGNLKTVLEWSKKKASRMSYGQKLATALGRFWVMAGWLVEGREYLEIFTQHKPESRSQ